MICVGSTLDSWRMVIPKQMTMKPMTRVIIWATGALRPLKRTTVVRMEKNVTREYDELGILVAVLSLPRRLTYDVVCRRD